MCIRFIVGSLMLGCIFSATAEEPLLSFEGSWCSHPCYYGSIHRPSDLPCQLDIDSSTIRWDWETKHKKKHFERHYSLMDRTSHSATLIVDGGNDSDWYAHQSISTVQWKLIFEANHGNQFAKDSLFLSGERYCTVGTACKKVGGSMFFIAKRKSACS